MRNNYRSKIAKGRLQMGNCRYKLAPLIFLFSFSFLLLTFLSASGGHTSADFLGVGVGARAVSLGEAYCAVSDNTDAVYWNPGGLTQVKGSAVSFTHLQYISGIRYGNISFAAPYQKGNIGVEINTLYTEDTRRGADGNKIDDFMNYNTAVTVAYAFEMADKMSVGIGLKGIYLKFDDDTSGGAAVDAGVLYKANKSIKFGLAIQNIGTKISGAELDTNLRCGVSYKIMNNWFAACDVNVSVEGSESIGLGSEYAIKGIVPVRVGYKYRSGGNDLGGPDGLCAGLGVNIKSYSLDYAFVPFGEFDTTHRVSLGVKW
ncbi:MAG: hypothetical protein BWY26_01207 [Elusimicrobia bacterium ADurb.Bin231]|nr:MAG: hypothetical protein BWY26_01207 [Elusimicrobia bacterium ADurb.Bin231]